MNIKFKFDESKFLKHKGHNDLTSKSITGSFPVYIFLLEKKEDSDFVNVLHFNWSMSSRVRPLNNSEAIDKVNGYNPNYVIKNELSEKIINNTTHILTGYYDLLNKEWHQINLEPVDTLTEKQMYDILLDTYIKSFNDFYNNEELYHHNIKTLSDDTYLAFLQNNELKEKANLYDIFILLFNEKWSGINVDKMNNTDLQKNTNKILDLLIQYLKNNNIEDSNFQSLYQNLRGHDILEYGIYDKKNKKIYLMEEISLIEKELFKERKEDFLQVPILGERIINALKNKNK
tara:strand:+ start:7101 stop:7964 length:864 start_codon:yes stop_codon:yes gene_type:complete